MMNLNKVGKKKDNSRKTGWLEDRRKQRRLEAIERNKSYQALSLEEKLARNSTKVRNKLLQGSN